VTFMVILPLSGATFNIFTLQYSWGNSN
jgi:hypothetical protein